MITPLDDPAQRADASWWATVPRPRQPRRPDYLERFGFRRLGSAMDNYNPNDLRGTYER